MTQTSGYLHQVLKKIEEILLNKSKVLVVFDIDSTLLDVSPRLQKILLDFAANPNNQKNFPESTKKMKEIQTLRQDWGIMNALIRVGLDRHEDPDFLHALKIFWLESFFSNYYLQFDKPYEGAVEFVNKIYDLGVDIVYLTGRDVERMGEGSRETMKNFGFPLGCERSQLVLKPDKSFSDPQFKLDWFSQLVTENRNYEKIYFFENEPLNVNLVRDHHKHVEIVFFESTHSGKAHPPEDLPRIMDYLLGQK